MKVTLFRRGKNKIWYMKLAGRWRSLRTDDEAIARAIKAKAERGMLLANLDIDDVLEPSALTFDQAWKKHFALHENIKAHATLRNDRVAFDYLATWAKLRGIQTINAVTSTHICQYQDYLLNEKKLKPVTVNDYVRHAGYVWRGLIKKKAYKGANPFKTVEALEKPRTLPKYRPWNHAVALVAASKAHGRDIHLAFVLGALMGLRRKEIQMQRWEFIDWQDRTFAVHKTKPYPQVYTVPLYKELVEALMPYRQDSGYIVKPEIVEWNDPGNRWYFERQWHQVFTTYNRGKEPAQQIKPFSPHVLRHSIATHLLSRGHSFEEVAAFLGHSDIGSTKVYAKLEALRPTLKINLDGKQAGEAKEAQG